MIISKRKKFIQNYLKLDSKIQLKFDERLKIFLKDPFDRILNNYALTWKYSWFRSINITWDYRAVFREYWENKYEF